MYAAAGALFEISGKYVKLLVRVTFDVDRRPEKR